MCDSTFHLLLDKHSVAVELITPQKTTTAPVKSLQIVSSNIRQYVRSLTVLYPAVVYHL